MNGNDMKSAVSGDDAGAGKVRRQMNRITGIRYIGKVTYINGRMGAGYDGI